ncbi:metallophosphoesterase [Alienimonas chondri]|uniref:LamG-like jellyroll fold domain-containing protein n=1 Tax=Alienimonas chondri TaxID=2681879 RepID=A0ABX1VBH7_9PLAN|nr:metallophosphoesterase [Alienimonas chondri]NNJ25409.1 hypothetical protein [Alienimonas chondri]
MSRPNVRPLFAAALGAVLSLLVEPASAHDGPDPLVYYRLNAAAVEGETLKARLGPPAELSAAVESADDGAALRFVAETGGAVIAPTVAAAGDLLPTAALTAAATVSIERPTRWGGIVGAISDDGEDEHGWLLGYDETSFTFAIAGADGVSLTYLKGRTPYERGKLYRVVGVYDGKTMQLWVNGQLDAESMEQSGPVRYAAASPFVLGAYRDGNEHHGLQGRLRSVSLYGLAAKQKWVEHDFADVKTLTTAPADLSGVPLKLVVEPYLQYGTQTGMTVMWRSTIPATGAVLWGETAECPHRVEGEAGREIHEIRLTELKPETQYFYRTETTIEGGATVATEVSTFQTAVKENTPFAFAVISDTQGNPQVSGQIAAAAWEHRPSFVLHPGDLVSTGSNAEHWTQHFFPGMKELIRYAPFYPVLGNHEQDARNYYDYVSLPDPEWFYTFRYGNAEFFMVDSNRNVGPDSEQYPLLEKALAGSTARWKIVCHHHPPYSSDENDYGDLWKSNVSTRGDDRIRQLTPLYEKHGVDIVWNGHIHSYERTWPIKAGRPVERHGIVYMITGGGGGPLETPGPIRPSFQNTVRRGHHFCMVRVNGGTLEFTAYALDGVPFDRLVIRKAPQPEARAEAE